MLRGHRTGRIPAGRCLPPNSSSQGSALSASHAAARGPPLIRARSRRVTMTSRAAAVWRQADAFGKPQDNGSRGSVFGEVEVAEDRSVAEENATRIPAFCRMEDVAGRRPMTETSRPMLSARSGLLRSVAATFVSGPRLTIVSGPALKARVRSAACAGSIEVVRSAFNAVDEPLWTRDVRASSNAPNQVARRSVDDGQRRIAENGRDPDDLDVRRVHEDEHRKAIIRIGVDAVARSIRIDPYTRRPDPRAVHRAPAARADPRIRQSANFEQGTVHVSGSRAAAKSNRGDSSGPAKEVRDDHLGFSVDGVALRQMCGPDEGQYPGPMPSFRTVAASARHRWPPGVSGWSRRRQARASERRSRSGLISLRPPNA